MAGKDPQQSAPIGFSTEESDLLLNILDPLIQRCKEQGNHAHAAMAVNLKTKIVHATMAKGVTDELRTSMDKSLQDAIASGDGRKIETMFNRVLTVFARIESDPGKAIAGMVMTYLGNMQSNLVAHSFIGLLGMITKKLDALLAEYTAANADAQAIELLNYLRGWVAAGVTDAQVARQPWETDTDVFPRDVIH